MRKQLDSWCLKRKYTAGFFKKLMNELIVEDFDFQNSETF